MQPPARPVMSPAQMGWLLLRLHLIGFRPISGYSVANRNDPFPGTYYLAMALEQPGKVKEDTSAGDQYEQRDQDKEALRLIAAISNHRWAAWCCLLALYAGAGMVLGRIVRGSW